jgi:hypothetical protein
MNETNPWTWVLIIAFLIVMFALAGYGLAIGFS